jgi:hypothetical protein
LTARIEAASHTAQHDADKMIDDELMAGRASAATSPQFRKAPNIQRMCAQRAHGVYVTSGFSLNI